VRPFLLLLLALDECPVLEDPVDAAEDLAEDCEVEVPLPPEATSSRVRIRCVRALRDAECDGIQEAVRGCR
jgi:hypothetical protein